MKKYFFLIFLITHLISADQLTIFNETGDDLFVAPYYVSTQSIEQCGSIQKIERWKIGHVQRPEKKWLVDRQLLFSTFQDQLSSALTFEQYQTISVKNIGSMQGNLFYINYQEGRLKGHNKLEWEVLRPFLKWLLKLKDAWEQNVEEVLFAIKQGIKNRLPAVTENRYKDTIAIARVGNELPMAEHEYREKRKAKTKIALERFLNRPLEDEQVPEIAFIASGGGYRAMAFTVGSLVGADTIGLLDSAMYISALSGSTWAIAPWIETGLPIAQYKEYLVSAMPKGLSKVSFAASKLIIDALLIKYAFDQSITVVDFYGALLANALLKDFKEKRQHIYLSDQMERIKSGDWIFPIYTAIRADKHASNEWWEVTPFEAGAPWLGIYFPTWGFGRRCNNGLSIDFAPEQSLGFFMGTFGSAFSATFAEIYEELEGSLQFTPTKIILKQLLHKIGKKRLTVAKFYNYTFGMTESPVKDLKKLRLADAGIDFNLPFPPLSGQRQERKPDILIFLDASADIKDAFYLHKVEEWAHEHNIKLPPIDYVGLEKSPIAIFKDDNDPEVPVIIYLPRIKDEELWNNCKNKEGFEHLIPYLDDFNPEVCIQDEYCGTFNFLYTEDEARKLMALTEFNMLCTKDKIIETINCYIDG